MKDELDPKVRFPPKSIKRALSSMALKMKPKMEMTQGASVAK
jgi:hypothetical protein